MMTGIDTSALKDVKTKRAAKDKAPWQPLDLTQLASGYYLGCDQSLTATGLVLLSIGESKIDVLAATKLGTEQTPYGGWEDVFVRTFQLEEQMRGWVRSVLPFPLQTMYLNAVHEAPPVGGGKFLKPELSLITAYAFRRSLKQIRLVGDQPAAMLPMVRPQDHKSLTCGNANAKKTEHHAALKEYYLPFIDGADQITNEAHRDALSVALTAAHREYKL